MKNIKKNLWIGLIWALLLFVLSFVFFFNISYMGVRDRTIEKTITDNFKGVIIFFNLKILLFYFIAALFIALFSLLLKIERKINIFLFHVFVWSWFLLKGIKISPQLFVEPLYMKGGLLKDLQVFITDVIR